MRNRITAGTAAAALIATGVLAGASLADRDGIGAARETAQPTVADPTTALARDGSRASGRRRGPVIDFFYAQNATVPPEGGGLVQPIKCPRGAGNPIAGGARTAVGIVVSYLSRVNPQTGGTPRRTYFVGVDDNSDANLAGSGAFVEVQCAKRIRVRD